MNQKGCVLWFTGLSARQVHRGIHAGARAVPEGKIAQVLDGDNIAGLNSNVDFSPEGREENIRRIGEVSKLFADSGMITLVSFISPYRADRDRVRERVGDKFVEVYMKIPLAVCEERDPKGLYKAARAGKIKGFTGIGPLRSPRRGDRHGGGQGGRRRHARAAREMAPPSSGARAEGLPQRVSRATRERDLGNPPRVAARNRSGGRERDERW